MGRFCTSEGAEVWESDAGPGSAGPEQPRQGWESPEEPRRGRGGTWLSHPEHAGGVGSAAPADLQLLLLPRGAGHGWGCPHALQGTYSSSGHRLVAARPLLCGDSALNPLGTSQGRPCEPSGMSPGSGAGPVLGAELCLPPLPVPTPSWSS